MLSQYYFPFNILSFLIIMFYQGDLLSGKAGNVREFDSCQGNIRYFTKSHGNVREKNLVTEKLPKTVYCKLYICISHWRPKLVKMVTTVFCKRMWQFFCKFERVVVPGARDKTVTLRTVGRRSRLHGAKVRFGNLVERSFSTTFRQADFLVQFSSVFLCFAFQKFSLN